MCRARRVPAAPGTSPIPRDRHSPDRARTARTCRARSGRGICSRRPGSAKAAKCANSLRRPSVTSLARSGLWSVKNRNGAWLPYSSPMNTIVYHRCQQQQRGRRCQRLRIGQLGQAARPSRDCRSGRGSAGSTRTPSSADARSARRAACRHAATSRPGRRTPRAGSAPASRPDCRNPRSSPRPRRSAARGSSDARRRPTARRNPAPAARTCCPRAPAPARSFDRGHARPDRCASFGRKPGSAMACTASKRSPSKRYSFSQ